MALDRLFEDVKLEQHPEKLESLMDWVRPFVPATLDKMNGLNFWISVQVRYTHPEREFKHIRPQ